MIEETAWAKLNLALHVRARRDDGYHALETLFVFARHGDQIALTPAEADSFTIVGPFADSLTGEDDNLVTRARDLFRERFGLRGAVAITLDKQLPVASGIGGGSADAAATLRGLAAMHMVDMGDPRLIDCAERLGSDVPACLRSMTALGQGRGETLSALAGMPGTPVLLVNPGVALSTGQVFDGWDGIDRGPIGKGDLISRAVQARNDLEKPAIALAPVIADVLSLLERQPGARLVRMSGSGATCFALFDSAQACADAASVVSAAHPDWWLLESELL
ncbi:4-(cytidine 5'-diphospho)-2-C-methyl-D-erythritol kinase [Stakelama sp. CBK3Z-3]|uniref:4-diphosphocytidyl-2-C-methyl-D-erythritol kinase n=1 Tax=Stakelama flava TaxID=2860338 RepID=A0ABS6XPL4_9SPHN|nr:4-(cytidine 5'-diphospho)-2-C-methyl-D-erythritol kinase [Stakelama flava]MBW4332061.1 4-(cytidine 5'-diphospho)-2-C-methyl-D-erythritol kinase [Stakelama flava]